MNELTMTLNSKLNIPLYEQIYRYMKEDICDGNLPYGDKLPSTRALAKYLEVSRSTVELAYEQLLSEGYIESIPCKGFYVAQLDGLYRQNRESEMPQFEKREKKKYLYDFSPNGIDLQSFPYNVWRRISKEVLLDDRSELFRSGDAQGEEELRYVIKQYLHQARGVNCSVEQIVVGAGNEYLLMLLGMLIGTEYKIAFENPTYKQAYRMFVNQGYEVAAIDMDRQGMRVDELQTSGADIAYVMPSHQYPLGVVMPIKRRMELLKWAAESGQRYIIEDDYDSEFRYKGKPIPALQGYDRDGKVIYLGTFSRAIAPAIRVSYMVLPKLLLETYRRKCSFLSCTVPKVDQYIVQSFIAQGHFERHLNKMRGIYKGRHDVLVSKLKPLLTKCRITGEHAGVHLLLSFQDGRKEEQLVKAAEARKIRVYGLSEYDTKPSEDREATVLLGYANLKEDDIVKAVEILCEIWK